MSELSAVHLPLAAWGFLVGFVGWASCFRLVGPIADWLLPKRAHSALGTGICHTLVLVFLIGVNLVAIAAVPAIVIAADGGMARGNAYWRSLLGVAFWASLAGFAALGFLQRYSRR